MLVIALSAMLSPNIFFGITGLVAALVALYLFAWRVYPNLHLGPPKYHWQNGYDYGLLIFGTIFGIAAVWFCVWQLCMVHILSLLQ